MIEHFLNSPVALGTFIATMGAVSSIGLAFGNRRDYVNAPREVAIGYRAAWLTAAAAWFADGVLTALGVQGQRGALAAPFAMVAAAVIGMYFTIHMKYARPGR